MFGFQYQEDGPILENEERSVERCYVSTAVFGSETYSMPNMLKVLQRNQSQTFSITYSDVYEQFGTSRPHYL